MARLAINGNVSLLMATQAIAHIQIYDARRCGLLRHVAMAGRALHSRTNVRGVIEPDMSGCAIVVHALPRNVLALRQIVGNFLDLRPILGNDAVAGHAETDVGNAGDRPLGDSHVTRLAHQAIREVRLVREGNRLHRLRSPT